MHQLAINVTIIVLVFAACVLAFAFLDWNDRRMQLRQWARERDTRVNRRIKRY